jgi:hypothetical protein
LNCPLRYASTRKPRGTRNPPKKLARIGTLIAFVQVQVQSSILHGAVSNFQGLRGLVKRVPAPSLTQWRSGLSVAPSAGRAASRCGLPRRHGCATVAGSPVSSDNHHDLEYSGQVRSGLLLGRSLGPLGPWRRSNLPVLLLEKTLGS